MSEKLDLFELSVKRGFEHYELPLDEHAWEGFKGNLNPSAGLSAAPAGGSFLGRFGWAAAALTALVLVINYGTAPEPDLAHETAVSTTEAQHNGHGAQATELTDAEINHIAEAELRSGAANNGEISETIELIASTDQVSPGSTDPDQVKSEEARIVAINDKLQTAADKAEGSNAKLTTDELKKKTTTRYVGKGFNLDASNKFSPNADGHNDTFLPAALKEGNLFMMTITDAKGKVVFLSDEVSKPWSGSDSLGRELDEGQYSWEVILTKDSNTKEIFKGVVRLER